MIYSHAPLLTCIVGKSSYMTIISTIMRCVVLVLIGLNYGLWSSKMGSDMDDHQNGVIFFNGMTPANKRVSCRIFGRRKIWITL